MTETKTIEIEIDGRKLEALPNQTVIQVADEAGIYIPRFCYHKHLTIAANCRMCLVDVEKSPKALPACATPVLPGMKVFTKSEKTIAAQRAVMEFLLINHPLDCPICDQGGECELQDLSMGYGGTWSHYDECKRSIEDENLGPLIATDMTRCIYCTRCVRFGAEIAGMRELGDNYRGEHSEIGTFVEYSLKSEVSGNVIDLCPVGALTSKPYRFTARAWELDQTPSVSPHDCIGTNIYVHTRYGKVMRVVSRENKDINETWISDRDRFSYTGLYHPDRLSEPMIKREGKWQVVEWHEALEAAANQLQGIIDQHGADELGALASPNSTLEEFYLLQKLVRGLGSANVDHRLREIDTRDQKNMPAFPGFNMTLSEIEKSDAIFVIGSNVQKELPLLALRLRKASLRDAVISVLNTIDYDFNFKINEKKINHDLPAILANLINTVRQDGLTNALTAKSCILLGTLALHHPQAAAIRYLASELAKVTGARLVLTTDGGNSAGGWLAGAVPHREAGAVATSTVGMNAYDMLAKPRKAYLLMNVEPDLDCANSANAIKAMQEAECVVAISMYKNPIIEQHAHIILPMAAFTETSGTFVNGEGVWQSFKGMATAFEEARPAWKILRVLANFLHLSGFDYESSEEVKKEVKTACEKMPALTASFSKLDFSSIKMIRIGEIPLYAGDSLVRRAEPLQTAQKIIEPHLADIRLHPKTAAHLELHDHDRAEIRQQNHTAILSVKLDEKMAENAIGIAGAINLTVSLGDLCGEIEIRKIG